MKLYGGGKVRENVSAFPAVPAGRGGVSPHSRTHWSMGVCGDYMKLPQVPCAGKYVSGEGSFD